MIVVFAGAGASKAVNPDEYPTTADFPARLPAAIRGNELFGTVSSLLSDKGEPADIESILWIIEELGYFFGPLADKATVSGKFMKMPLARKIIGDYSRLLHGSNRIIGEIRDLKDSINCLVYDFYRRIPQRSELDRTWLTLLGKLTLFDRDLEIFTTNYDLILETTIDHMISADPNFPVSAGRNVRVRPELDLSLWQRKGQKGLLTKLHGSVDWCRAGDQIVLSEGSFQGDHAKHIVIYPGFKGRPKDEPFSSFHDYFKDKLCQASVVICIGFAFRDEYINSMLNRNVRADALKILIDPIPSRPPFKAGLESVKLITMPFGENAVEECWGILQSFFDPVIMT